MTDDLSKLNPDMKLPATLHAATAMVAALATCADGAVPRPHIVHIVPARPTPP